MCTGDREATDAVFQHTVNTENNSVQELGVPSPEAIAPQPPLGHQQAREDGASVSASVPVCEDLSSISPQTGGEGSTSTEQQQSMLQDSVDHERRLSSTPVDASRESSPPCCNAEEMDSRHPKVAVPVCVVRVCV